MTVGLDANIICYVEMVPEDATDALKILMNIQNTDSITKHEKIAR